MLAVVGIFSICVGFVVCDFGGHALCKDILPLDCATSYIPNEPDELVCGTDAVTYNNFCFYSQARCKDPSIQIAKIGDCSATAPPPVTATTAATTAATNPATNPTSNTPTASTMMTTSASGVATPDPVLQVFCQSKDAITCQQDLDPICGSDKNFYLNQCEFTKAKCDNLVLSKRDISFCTGAAAGGK